MGTLPTPQRSKLEHGRSHLTAGQAYVTGRRSSGSSLLAAQWLGTAVVACPCGSVALAGLDQVRMPRTVEEAPVTGAIEL